MTKYGKLENGILVYAPTALFVDGGWVSPNADMYLAQGWKPVFPPTKTPRSKREGFHYEFDGWVERARGFDPKWKLVRDPRVFRVFSKMKVVAALEKAGLWTQVKAWIEQEGLYDIYLAAQDFAEDNKYFRRGKKNLQTALGLTDEQVESILAASVAE